MTRNDTRPNAEKQQAVRWFVVSIAGLVIVVALLLLLQHRSANDAITTFQACKDAGGTIAESYPEQCFINGKSFTNDAQADSEIDQYIGLAEQEALDTAKQNNKTARVVERDGESLPVTMDFSYGRLNFTVTDDKVTNVDVEGDNQSEG